MSLLGIDIGGSGCKAIAYSKEGKRLAKSSRSYSYILKKEHESEFDLKEIWEKVRLVIKEASQKVKKIGDPIEALCFSVFGEASILVDKDLNPLTDVFTSFDQRGYEFMDKIATDINPVEMYSKTGQPLDFLYPPIRLMWLKKYKKDLYEKASKFLGVQEYFLLKLGGEPITEPSLACRYLIFDINKKDWVEEYLEYFDMKKESFLPVIGKAGDIAGTISKKMASELGLANNVKLIVGGFDQSMSSLGAGLLFEDISTISTGTVEAMCFVKKNIDLDKELYEHYFPFCNHAYGDLLFVNGYTYSGGSVLKWFLQEIATDSFSNNTAKDVYEEVLKRMPDRPSVLETIPTFTGSQTFIRDPKLKGIILGLSLTTDKNEILKSLLEGTCFYLKQNYEYLSKKLDFTVKKFNAMGGGAQSPQWLQMKADILNTKINTISEEDTGCIAAAILAGIGTGIFENFDDTIKNFIKVEDEYLPRDNYVEFYSKKYNLYKNLQDKLIDSQHELYQINSDLYENKFNK
ncbi:Xylulose kinase [subsurface metagenome]